MRGTLSQYCHAFTAWPLFALTDGGIDVMCSITRHEAELGKILNPRYTEADDARVVLR